MINDVQFIQLMRDCWDEHPTLRPDFSTIRSRFILINKGKYDKVLFIELIVEPKTTINQPFQTSLKGHSRSFAT